MKLELDSTALAERRAVILFGAGEGTNLFLRWTRDQSWPGRVLFIVDNDATLWGKELHGLPIREPKSLRECPGAFVLITSISGRDAISDQLAAMGLSPAKDFQPVVIAGGHEHAVATFQSYRDALRAAGRGLEGSRALHVGPGGFLGVEALLYAHGIDHVSSIEKHRWGLEYPDVTARRDDYRALQRQVRSREAADRMSRLFVESGPQTRINPDLLKVTYPVDIQEMPFPDGAFDLCLADSVLEHVEDPSTAVREIRRVLRPGGLTVQTIVTRDHRSFSSVAGYNAFSFRAYTTGEWERIAREKFHQNRTMPREWKNTFKGSSFRVLSFNLGERIPIAEGEKAGFDAAFRSYPIDILEEVDCTIVAEAC